MLVLEEFPTRDNLQKHVKAVLVLKRGLKPKGERMVEHFHNAFFVHDVLLLLELVDLVFLLDFQCCWVWGIEQQY